MEMDYSDIEITVLNMPRLEILGNGRCCKRYFYRFVNSLPAQNEMNSQVKQLDYKFTYSKEGYDIPEDISVCAQLGVERLNDLEAIFIVSIAEPEEDVNISIYGGYALPGKIEKIFGVIESIQGDSREMWIKDNTR
jgi:hypothetical protein